ncbi:hypothetical protein ACFLS1_04285 [Verrucomicrobiota bacterium]
MKKSRSYSMGIIGLPSVLVALGWIGLWFAWPLPPEGHTADIGKEKTFEVSYVQFDDGKGKTYLDPIILSRSSDNGNAWPDEGEERMDVLCSYQARPPKFLERHPEEEQEASRFVEYEALYAKTIQGLEKRGPRWRRKLVDGQSLKPERDMVMIIELSEKIKEYGFQIPDFPVKLKEYSQKPWLVTVYVEVNQDGKAEHVFLVTGSNSREVNDIVIRTMEKGKLVKPGERCSGRITVSFGAQ